MTDCIDKTESLIFIKPYIDFLKEITISNKFTYTQLVIYLWVCEDCYLKWAHDSPKYENLNLKYQTWINLHNGNHFIEWVRFLKGQVDKFQIREVEKMFVKKINNEYDLFEACYYA